MIGDLLEVGMSTPSWCGRGRIWESPGWQERLCGSCRVGGLKREMPEAWAFKITPSGEERMSVRMINGDCSVCEDDRATLVCEWSQPNEGVGK
jgi:hypothetical protein